MRTRAVMSALAFAASLACADSLSPDVAGNDPTTGAVASIRMSSRSLQIGVGDTTRLTATTRSRKQQQTSDPVEWSSDAPSVAIVEDGLVVGLGAGSALVVARSGTATTTTTVYVRANDVGLSNLTVVPDSVTLAPDSVAQLSATLRFSNEVTVNLRKSLTWTALDTAIVAVSGGRVTARGAGRGLVVAGLAALLDTTVVSCSGASTAPVVPDTTTADTTPPARAGSYFVAPNGSRVGAGTADSPWDLVTALNQPGVVQPGDTLWLRGGSYKGDFTSRLTGTSSAPIVVRQAAGERATIDGRLRIEGSYAHYWGFEVTSSDPQRVSAQSGGEPSDLPRSSTVVSVTGSYVKLINLVAHDLGQGVFGNMAAVGLELSGNLIYNNGWRGADRGHGHNVYLQNDGPTKNVLDNVIFGSFAAGLHIYGSEQAVLRNFRVEGNTIFESGEPLYDFPGSPRWNVVQYGGTSFGATVYRGNSIYHRDPLIETVKIGTAGSPPGSDIEFRDNVIHGFSTFNEVRRYTITNNRFTTGSTPVTGQSALVAFRPVPGEPISSNSWNDNRYAVPSGSTQLPFYVAGQGGYLLPGWKSATGYDGASTMTDRFVGTTVIVRPSPYERGRAFVTVWNWDRAGAVNVDLSGVLSAGDAYQIHHVYDVFGAPIATGTYGGGSISVPQPAIAPPVPTGYRPYGQPTPDFGVFLVRKR